MPPEKLYRYCKFNEVQFRQIVLSSKIPFSRPANFNDPYDCLLQLDYEIDKKRYLEYAKEDLSTQAGIKKDSKSKIKKFIRSEKKAFKSRAQTVKDAGNDIFESFRQTTQILCLSKLKSSIVLFSHYSDSHRGICFEFSTCNADAFTRAREVKYREDYTCVNYFANRELLPQIIIESSITKSKEWKYEEEWRVVSFKNPYFIEEFNPASLTGITMGANISKENRNLIEEILSKRKIPLFQARISKNKYELEITSVNK